MRSIAELKIKLFADGADKAQILQAQANPLIKGFTTNPTLMRAAGVKDYEAFAREILTVVTDKPISYEVFADDFSEMERQAHKIAGWAKNVYVKIPITNTKREPSIELIRRLSHSGVKVNVTAILTMEQVRNTAAALAGGEPSVVSVFAGRIAERARSCAFYDRGGEAGFPTCGDGAAVGKPARATEYLSGQRHWLSHHYRDRQCSEQAKDRWEGSGPILA